MTDAADTAEGARRRALLGEARLYLVVEAAAGERMLDAALGGGVDVVQLRDKTLDDEQIGRAGRWFRAACDGPGALLILNDRPDLAAACGADGVHVGQDDVPAAEARRLVGPELLVGVSTHTPAQIDAADADPAVDYLGVGPVFATATKPGVAAVGVGLVAHAAAHATTPWFAIGGIDPNTVAGVTRAGARRIAVVRAIRDAADPGAAAAALRAAVLDEAPVGQAR